MIRRLPRWVGAGAWALAFVAGYVNVVGLLGFEQQAMTHITGTGSHLAAATEAFDLGRALELSGVIVAFFVGAVVSGSLTRDSTLRLGRRYGIALIVEAGLLACSAVLLSRDHATGVMAASCSAGLQNAMVTTYSGSVVRTTHLTGTVTDLGVIVGQRLRGIPADGRKVRLFSLVLAGFVIGGICGAAGFGRFGHSVLYAPAALILATGCGYVVYRHTQLRRRRPRPG